VNKRIVAAALWFVSLSSLGGFGEAYFNVPAEIGGVLGIAVAILVIVDPTHYVWRARHRSTAAIRTTASSH
jgi:uncharacterized membrane protein (DUF485 family)